MGFARWTLAAGLLAGFGVLATGCEVDAVTYREHRRYDDRPIVVQQQQPVVVQGAAPVYVQPLPPAPEPVYVEPPVEQQVLVVQQAPPPLPREVQPRMPGPGMAWIGGHWVVSGGRWLLVAGHWERPPHPGARWAPHHWDHVGTTWHLTVGGWH